MQQDGIEVRGITQPDGTAEFNEVFFDDARCPKENVVGGLNNGWKVANDHASASSGACRPPPATAASSEEFDRMVAEARAQRRASTTR